MTGTFRAREGIGHPGSIGEESFREVAAVFEAARPRRILEFGSGASTLALAERFPEARVESYEHDASFHRGLSELLEERGVAGRVELVLSPLRFRFVAGGWFLTYGSISATEPVDCILVDGPRSQATLRGREACLYLSFARLRVGGVVVLDDLEREHERRIAANWESAYPHVFSRRVVGSGHGLLILTKTAEAKPRMSVRRVLDNAQACLRLGLRALRHLIRRRFPRLARLVRFILNRLRPLL